MIAVAPHKISDIRIDPFPKFGRVIPELPSGSVVNHKKPKLVASIHKGGVLRTMGVSNHIHACFFQFYGIATVSAVAQGVPDQGMVLMPVGTNQSLRIRLSVEIESLFAFEFQTAYANAAAIAVDRFAVSVVNTYNKIIEMRSGG